MLGRLAQLVERSLHTREVIGPNPIPPILLFMSKKNEGGNQ